MVKQAKVFIDQTHCGRHVTGLERITLELFSQNALAPLEVVPIPAKTRVGMLLAQMLKLPFLTFANAGSVLICPGFPPSPLATWLGPRVLPYIHDLFLLTRKQDLNFRARWLMRGPFGLAVRHLPRFLVNSQSTAQELATYCRPDAQIILYRPKVRDIFGLRAGPRSSASGTPKPRLVALGTVEPRKNLFAAVAIVEALRMGGFPEAQLEIVGRPGWGVDMDALARAPGVVLHGYQPLERVREILQDADALLSTAHDEGLGLPLLEAQYGGLAVIAPDKPVFREVLGESGVFIDPENPVAAAQIIGRLALHPDWRAEAEQAARDNLRRWNGLAAADHAQVMQLLNRLCGATMGQAEAMSKC
ncbi:MAG: glycosyltransferase [Hyphomicrobiales bacterium]|nr:glycosyltransferase [Hyphomicrobiales bacterium]MDE2115607.1 glycosyltransferase [Hyphomicrobiales bacterium]